MLVPRVLPQGLSFLELVLPRLLWASRIGPHRPRGLPRRAHARAACQEEYLLLRAECVRAIVRLQPGQNG